MINVVKKHIKLVSPARDEERLRQKLSYLKPRPVTAVEFCRVSFVTIREGVNHRRWPREVIEQFLLAEV